MLFYLTMKITSKVERAGTVLKEEEVELTCHGENQESQRCFHRGCHRILPSSAADTRKLGAWRSVAVFLAPFCAQSKVKEESRGGQSAKTSRGTTAVCSKPSHGKRWQCLARQKLEQRRTNVRSRRRKEGGQKMKRKGGWCFVPERTDCTDASRSFGSSSRRRVQPPVGRRLPLGDKAKQLARGGELLILLSARRLLCS